MGDEAHLTIADDGIGNSPRSTGSSGLGQRLVASFAQQLGGSLEVRTEKGRMTIINFPAPRKGPPARTSALENRLELAEPVVMIQRAGAIDA
jgi:two-component sensor histidine kinase